MIGPLISAGASLASSLLGKSASDKANKQQAAMADKNIALQKEFAQSGIQWKVEDARKAGIHPLYALGANTTSFSPVSVGSSVPDFSGIAAAGQDIGRAIDSTRSQSGKAGAIMQSLALQRAQLENQLLASQIAKVNQTITPPMPTSGDRYLVDGQTQSGLSAVETSPMARQSVDASNPSVEAGAIGDVGYSRTPTGYAIMHSKDAHDRMEDDFFAEMSWNVRNRLAPMIFDSYMNPPPVELRPHEYWEFNPLMGEYQVRSRPIQNGMGFVYGGR